LGTDYSYEDYKADHRYKEQERQKTMASLELAIEYLHGVDTGVTDLTPAIRILKYEMERLRGN
jgi:hypothetical protein